MCLYNLNGLYIYLIFLPFFTKLNKLSAVCAEKKNNKVKVYLIQRKFCIANQNITKVKYESFYYMTQILS